MHLGAKLVPAVVLVHYREKGQHIEKNTTDKFGTEKHVEQKCILNVDDPEATQRTGI